jgi:hypothetical protein|nr:MAG TPA: hypothetical protein [Caudoviricetes sp.]
MKQFDLQEYLKNPQKKIVTSDGESARIICTDRNPDYPIVALVGEAAAVNCYTKEGQYFGDDAPSSRDLFFAPEKKTGWINVSRIAQGNAGEITYTGAVYPTKEEAIAGYSGVGLLDTIKIEWEE